MKSLTIIMSLSFSIAAFAKVPATTAVTNLLPVGEYSSENCSVSVSLNRGDAVTVKVATEEGSNSFTTLNDSVNYSVNELTGEFQAFQNLAYPKHLGGLKSIIVKKIEDNKVEAFISNVYLDGNGNDIGSYVSCSVKVK